MRLCATTVGRMLRREVLIEQAEPTNDNTPHIGKQRVDDTVLRGELGEDRDRIVAHREDRNAFALIVRQTALQLDELRLAERSPGGAAVKEHQRPPRSADAVQVDDDSRSIRQGNIGEPLAETRADLLEVERR